jgi:hypothetical protein
MTIDILRWADHPHKKFRDVPHKNPVSFIRIAGETAQNGVNNP